MFDIRELLDGIGNAGAITINYLKMRWLAHYSRVAGKPSPSGLAYVIYETIAAVPPDQWNECNRNNDVFLSSDYLAALEEAPPGNMRFRYVLFTDRNGPVAIGYFQLLELGHRLHRPAKDAFPEDDKKYFGGVHAKMADTLSHRILVCGNVLLSGEHGYAFNGCDERVALHAIAEAAYAIRRSDEKHISALVIKDFYERSEHPVGLFSQFGYYSFDAGPNMVVPIRENWTSFDAYLKQMKSKYRQRAMSAVKKGAKLHRQSLDMGDLVTHRDELFALYCEVVDKARYKLFVLSPGYFIALKKRLGDRFVCDAYFDEGKIVGFTTRIMNGSEMEGYVHGLRYALSKTFELYQNFLLDDVREAIAANRVRVNSGRTSIAMKSSVGAIPESMRCYLRFSGKLSNQLIGPLLYFLKPSEEYCRRPFDE